MTNIDLLFDAILRFCLISFVLLGAGVFALRFLKQPVERIRLIQISLLSVLLASLWCFASFKPTIDLAVFPASESSSRIHHEDRAEGFTKVLPVKQDSNRDGGADLAAHVSLNQENIVPPENFELTKIAVADTSWENPTNKASIVENGRNKTTAKSRALPGVWPLAKQIIVVAFLIGSVLHAAYLAFGFFLTQRLVSQAQPLESDSEQRARESLGEIGAAAGVRIVSSDRIVVPIATGIFRPTIVLPEHLANSFADPLELKHSLAHEWKHIEQLDLATWQLISICQFVMWIQPWYWTLRRELRISQDQIADQFATTATDEHAAYAATLVRLSQGRQTVLPGALSMAGTKSNLYRRVEMLLNENMGIAGFSRKRVLFGFASLTVTAGLLLASLQLSHAATPVPNPGPVAVDDSGGKKPKEVETKDEESPKESVEHFGYVFDVITEKPIEGVTVTVRRMKSKTWTPIGETKTQTDAEGKFLFPVPPEQLKLSDLYILFDVDHPEYAQQHCGSYSYSMLMKNLKIGDRPWYEKLHMIPGAKLSGRIVDKDHKPVAGAHMRATSRDERFVSKGIHGQNIDLVSDEDGRFETVVNESSSVKLSIIPIAHGMKYVELGEKRGDFGDIVLSDGVVARGVVRDAKGEPMKGMWVNLQPTETEREASYEMLRSTKTGDSGEFETRPLEPGSYKISVQTKATGAIEKKEYANFHNEPPSAMFVDQTIEVTEDSVMKPFVIQAVPHVTISMQYYKPNGETRGGHSADAFYEFDGQNQWIREAKKVGNGGWKMMLPHGAENVQLNFVTNEHSALTIQFEGEEPSTQSRFRFPKIEEDIDNIRIVRYVAPILQVKIVDESGVLIREADVSALYTKPMKDAVKDEMIEMTFNQVNFEKQSNGIRKSSQVVPGVEFELAVSADGFAEQEKLITMEDGKDELITVTLKKASDDTEDKGDDTE